MSAFSLSDNSPPLALLAGGLGTRLGQLTAALPKSLVTVAGEPFIAHQLRLLAHQGVSEVVICSGHLCEQIQAFVGDGSQFGCRVSYSPDGAQPLGTGGAIRNALDRLGSYFWVMYGDSYLTAPFAPVLEAFLSSGKPALMTVFANENGSEKSNVMLSGNTVIRYDKHADKAQMTHIDYGLGLFRAELFRRWPGSATFDLSQLQSRLVDQGLLASYEVAERYYEIGSMSGLEETDAFLRNHNLIESAPAGKAGRAATLHGAPA
jgi:NDP-sugar pyrophosphorylase family protein